MSKEMIVSVNGREKKIAVIENGQVTEFYIERGEATAQGIVGNIYKGRVMRVLPGMQSAFVDIGLERDAFLYVSDFFDEEEEFERIVIEKPKPEAAAAGGRAAAPPAPVEDERPQRSVNASPRTRTERPPRGAETPERTAAARASESAPEIADETIAGDGGRKRRRRRGRGGADAMREEIPAQVAASDDARGLDATMSGEAASVASIDDIEDMPGTDEAYSMESASPFAAEWPDASFERVIDEDKMGEEGEMLKDAILQERLFDQIRAGEFNIEATSPTEVGGLLSTAGNENLSSFQRIDDSDIEASAPPTAAPSGRARSRETAASIDSLFLDNVANEEMPETAPLFERVSDDESASGEAQESEAASSAPAKRSRSTRGAKTKQTAATSGKKATGEQNEPAEEQKKPTSRTPRAASTGRASTDKTASGGATKKSSPRTKRATDDASATKGAKAKDGEKLADAEASVTSRRARGEFSTRRRRGGSRRRPNRAPSEVAVIEDENGASENDSAQPIEIENELPGDDVQTAIPALLAPVQVPSTGGGQTANRQAAHPNGGNGRGRERRERHAPPPMITDLLREGQEIIVQIAKEPISQKGARITSHIALPGRFLVYMPTIEHVGVSRKIESDSERVRLRKMIQTIRAEEDVPSGGFIVRTAGTGITELDLREDARYLVRTWRDIRRAAEKQKAPALAHRDLDLVQRLLRDQLSEDFTAIRVDSEEEYLQIVEFVNRIQPRLTNRVKLYTRDEPILDAFGVQAEIDKAIKPRVWLRSGGYLVINQTEALVAIDVNTGKFVGRGGSRLEDTITKTNMEAVEEIARQIRLRDLGGIIVLDLIDMEDRRNRTRVLQALHEALADDKSPTKVLSFNDFGLVIMTRKRVKQSLERTLCTPCQYCQGAGLVKSAATVCYEILEESRRLARGLDGERVKQTTLRVNPEVARALRSSERDVLTEIEDYLGVVDITSDDHVHQEQFDFAFV